jgi:SAM-dependent methyltransferase
MTKVVLDACCGGRMMWFDKSDDRCLFADRRNGEMKIGHLPSQKGRSPVLIAPEQIHDFRDMPYEDGSFHHVVFDPPHVCNLSEKSILGFKYGSLNKETWREDLAAGFAECFRVLKPYGTLIFKWNEVDIPLREVLALTDQKPLYGHKSGKKANTHWVAFIKTGVRQ